jgi:hypothetical protein
VFGYTAASRQQQHMIATYQHVMLLLPDLNSSHTGVNGKRLRAWCNTSDQLVSFRRSSHVNFNSV